MDGEFVGSGCPSYGSWYWCHDEAIGLLIVVGYGRLALWGLFDPAWAEHSLDLGWLACNPIHVCTATLVNICTKVLIF